MMCLCVDYLSLEKEVVELRTQLRTASVRGEVEELKRTLDRKEKERLHLSIQVEVCISVTKGNGYVIIYRQLENCSKTFICARRSGDQGARNLLCEILYGQHACLLCISY